MRFNILLIFTLTIVAIVSGYENNLARSLITNNNRLKKMIEKNAQKYGNETDQSFIGRMQTFSRYVDELMVNLEQFMKNEKLNDIDRPFFQSLEEELVLMQNTIEYELKNYEEQQQHHHHDDTHNDDDHHHVDNDTHNDDQKKFILADALLKDGENLKKQVEKDLKNPNYNANLLKLVQKDFEVLDHMCNHLIMFKKIPQYDLHQTYQLYQIEQESIIIQNRLINRLIQLRKKNKNISNGHISIMNNYSTMTVIIIVLFIICI
ncbi:uncharacterized protein LOC113792404 [Dermatophagoides pteronyssinus]|uniref:uncharacterized protein LOC113792404 n=1 Tax=Dermatophagoides pteronyssinus TaxID=6956 RepID=UPI003F67FBDD